MTIFNLVCREHLQPLLRFHHYSLGVQVHVACWPFCDSVADGAPPHFSSDAQIIQAKFAALEGQMFVISSTQLLSPQNAELCRCVLSCRVVKSVNYRSQPQGCREVGNACKPVSCWSGRDQIIFRGEEDLRRSTLQMEPKSLRLSHQTRRLFSMRTLIWMQRRRPSSLPTQLAISALSAVLLPRICLTLAVAHDRTFCL